MYLNNIKTRELNTWGFWACHINFIFKLRIIHFFSFDIYHYYQTSNKDNIRVKKGLREMYRTLFSKMLKLMTSKSVKVILNFSFSEMWVGLTEGRRIH